MLLFPHVASATSDNAPRLNRWQPCLPWDKRMLHLWMRFVDDRSGYFCQPLFSREVFIFQIADVHLLDSATWWRLLGQKYLLTAEVTAPIKGRKVGRLVWE